MLRGKTLINFLEYLRDSFNTGLPVSNIVNNLKSSFIFKNIGLKIENDIINNKIPLSISLRKNNIVPDYVSYILEAGEKSGTIVELISALISILENFEKIKQETKIYKSYVVFVLFLIILGILLFKFIFNNVFLIVLQDINTQNNFTTFIKNLNSLLSFNSISMLFILIVLVAILLSFRNIFLDIFEYYILGRPYRNLILSNLMIIIGNLIRSALAIPLALYISVLTIENSILKELIYKHFKNHTNNFTEFNLNIANKIFLVFPKEYYLLLVNSFTTGNIDDELIKLGNKLHSEATNSLKIRFFKILIFIIVLSVLFLGFLITISFLSIYLPLLQDIN
jgi:type II secretory pathway component PulF